MRTRRRAAACLDAGCHVLLEKPVSHSVDGLDRLAEAELSSSGEVLVGFQFRFHPALQRMRELLERNAIGRPLHAEVFWGEYLPSWHPWEDWRRSYAAVRELGGGVHHTICHPFDYLRWLFGDAQVVHAALTTNGPLGLDVAEAADVLLRFRSDVTAHVRLDYWSRPQAHHVEIICTEGTIAWDFMTGELRVWSTATGTWVTTELPSVESRNELFVDEARHFLEVVNGALARSAHSTTDSRSSGSAQRSNGMHLALISNDPHTEACPSRAPWGEARYSARNGR